MSLNDGRVRRTDVWLGVVVVSFAIVTGYKASTYLTIASSEPLGPAFLPLALCGSLLILGVALAVFALRRQSVAPVETDHDSEERSSPHHLRLVLATLLFAAYVLSLPYVDFFLATAVSTYLFLWVGGNRSLVVNVSVAAGVTAFCYIVFVLILKLPLADI